MNDDFGGGIYEVVAKRRSIEDVDNNTVNARGTELTRGLRITRAAGDVVTSGNKERRQATADGAASAGEKNSHARRPGSSRAFQALQGFGDLGFAHERFLALLFLFFDDLFRRAGDEIGIAELGVDPGDVGVALRHLLGEPRALGGKIDNTLERQCSDVAAYHELHGAAWGSVGKGNLADPSQALYKFRPTPRTLMHLRRSSDKHERQCGRGRDVHFDPHGTDGRYEIDHPTDLCFRVGSIEIVESRP